jgi:hypothetical protein
MYSTFLFSDKEECVFTAHHKNQPHNPKHDQTAFNDMALNGRGKTPLPDSESM